VNCEEGGCPIIFFSVVDLRSHRPPLRHFIAPILASVFTLLNSSVLLRGRHVAGFRTSGWVTANTGDPLSAPRQFRSVFRVPHLRSGLAHSALVSRLRLAQCYGNGQVTVSLRPHWDAAQPRLVRCLLKRMIKSLFGSVTEGPRGENPCFGILSHLSVGFSSSNGPRAEMTSGHASGRYQHRRQTAEARGRHHGAEDPRRVKF
jgi:hypothetical protein